ncbi:G2/mitotic-specific cyclin-b [Plakobranchus ocellatus]|uniref:G2/mitotic-specific cyclin-b n=1 Tax=Plakobranchus ocellatus TaxID=259542 RepID=A0AAV4BJ20_9GAST|nr:G2/mitotic-specific cyclin-b [Plakobranchus ocellatus]
MWFIRTLMASSHTMGGVTTRQMLKRLESNSSMVAGDGKDGDRSLVGLGRRKTSRRQAKDVDKEDAPLDDWEQGKGCDSDEVACDTNSRTFPLEHSEQMCMADSVGKRQPKTETASKQKRTLVDRGRNVGQAQRKATRQVDFSSKTEIIKERCSVVVSPMEVSLPPTPGVAAAACDSSISNNISDTTQCCNVPKDVTDIDKRVDNFIPSTYNKEIVQYWLTLEPRHVMDPGFLNNSPDVTSQMRSVLMDWLLQVQDHEELQDETMHLCRVLIDRILAKGGVIIAQLQLVGITCLLIASKFCERFCTEIKVLCYLTDNTYTEDQVIAYEKKILVALDWDITGPVCTHFLGRILEVHGHSPEIRHLSMYLLDLSVVSVKLASVLPSKMAAAALLLARRVILTPGIGPFDSGVPLSVLFSLSLPWTRDLQFYTGYVESDLLEEEKEFEKLLFKARHSKYQVSAKV